MCLELTDFCLELFFYCQMNMLTVTGLDANVTRSVGSFVSQVIDRLVAKRLLSTMSWQGTNEKVSFQAFDAVVDVIKGEIGFSWHLNVRNVTLNNRMSCESVSRGNEDELQDHRPSN